MSAEQAVAPFDRPTMARMVAADIPEGWYVNLGIGLPTLVADHIPTEREVILHSENGILGMGPLPAPGEADPWLVNAGKENVTLVKGAALFHHGDSFAMIRGGHLDLCVLGAFEVAENGDLANWSTSASDRVPAVGGAMDLGAGARNVWVMTTHSTKAGDPKLVSRCTYPLTALRAVKRIYSDLAVIDVTGDGFVVRDMAPGVTPAGLQELTGAKLHFR
ncbi:3-oxoacid CoA-transferase subunit B [Mesorhizobium sp. 8]|uniref:3-oxoacid CoA-transferase subunit B n=1 Tax=Mesorhizobium sp. 8 TaxID=2584466 RepID=UPI0015D664D5|nr:3-oxoacid CoA-transferase subunit B [Mesorhizobium sp. 8]